MERTSIFVNRNNLAWLCSSNKKHWFLVHPIKREITRNGRHWFISFIKCSTPNVNPNVVFFVKSTVSNSAAKQISFWPALLYRDFSLLYFRICTFCFSCGVRGKQRIHYLFSLFLYNSVCITVIIARVFKASGCSVACSSCLDQRCQTRFGLGAT